MTFLIDIGNVLLNFDFTPSFEALMPAEVTDRQQRIARLIEKKDDFEAGGLSLQDYRSWAKDVLSFTGPDETFNQLWCDIFIANPPMWNLCKQLRKDGHRLIIFSNTNELHGPYVLGRYPDFEIFHHLIFSYQVGSIKPEPAIFDYATATYSLDPSETVYIDDLPANIAEGRRRGIHCFTYDSAQHERSLAGLEKLIESSQS